MQSNTSIYDVIDETKVRCYDYSQDDDKNNTKHFNNFKDIVEVIKHPEEDVLRMGD